MSKLNIIYEKTTIPELAIKIGISERSIERNLQVLQKNNIIKRTGGAKGGRWEFVKNYILL